MRSVALGFLVFASFMVVAGGCSGPATFSYSPPTTSLNQPRAATVIVHLKAGTSASQALSLENHLGNPAKGINGSDGIRITGSDWSVVSPRIVHIYLASETAVAIDHLLPAIRKMPHVADVTVQFG
jgi:hypothetical protein